MGSWHRVSDSDVWRTFSEAPFYIVIDALVVTSRTSINALALNARLPTMHGNRESVAAGGLISYGPNFPELWRRSADYMDKILRGAKPADIPIERPAKFDLVINSRLRRRKVFTLAATTALPRRRGDRMMSPRGT